MRRKEPDGKSRAPTGVGRWGQRKVSFHGYREARLNGLPPEHVQLINSHSTRTSGDALQSDSLMVGRVMEAIAWAIKHVSFLFLGPVSRIRLLPREAWCGCAFHRKPRTRGSKSRLGLPIASTEDPSVMRRIVGSWPRALRKEQGLNSITAECHPKGAGYRHTIGGTSIEQVSLLLQSITGLTLPRPGLNNLIDEMGSNPVAITFPNMTDINTATCGPVAGDLGGIWAEFFWFQRLRDLRGSARACVQDHCGGTGMPGENDPGDCSFHGPVPRSEQ